MLQNTFQNGHISFFIRGYVRVLFTDNHFDHYGQLSIWEIPGTVLLSSFPISPLLMVHINGCTSYAL